MKAGWALLLVGVFPAAAQEPPKNPFAGDAEAIEAGRGTFRIYCSPCHGIKGDGGRGPDLTLGVYTAGSQDADLHRVIAGGAPGTEMPDFGERLGHEHIWRLVAYIRSIAGKPTPPLKGDRATGEKLFWGKGGCGGCHRIGTKGGRMGPDLTMVGRQRSLNYLREAVLTPDAYLTPGNNTITVVLKDGKKIQGVQRGYDAFSAQFIDAAENFHSYSREEATSIQREFRSLMPNNYGKMFNESEINDLLVFMTSLRGQGGK